MLLEKNQIQKLLEPINHKFACGVYLKEADNGSYRFLKAEYNQAQAALLKLSQDLTLSDSEHLKKECRESWLALSEHLYEIFLTTTKDIELISWFICSQLILDDSMECVANSFSWLSELTMREWPVLNPVSPQNKLLIVYSEKIREQNYARTKAFSQLLGDSETSGLLYVPLLAQPLVGKITFGDYNSAKQRGKVVELKKTINTELEHCLGMAKHRMDNIERCQTAISNLERFLIPQLNATHEVSIDFSYLKKIFVSLNDALLQLTGLSSAGENVQTSGNEGIKRGKRDPGRPTAVSVLTEVKNYKVAYR